MLLSIAWTALSKSATWPRRYQLSEQTPQL